MTMIRVVLLFICPILFSSCAGSMHMYAKKAGGPPSLRDASIVCGTFENMSIGSFGPKSLKLWDVLVGHAGVLPYGVGTSQIESSYSDRVKVTQEGPSALKVALVASGVVRQTASLPFTMRSNHLHLRHSSDFAWLPLGYRSSSTDTALTAQPEGDLIVLHHFDIGGIVMLIGSAGDAGTIDFRFPRLDSRGRYTARSLESLGTSRRRSQERAASEQQ